MAFLISISLKTQNRNFPSKHRKWSKSPIFFRSSHAYLESMKTDGKNLYSLMPLDDFKAVLGIDDREDKLARFCLVTASLTIEQYCKRRFLRKKYIFEK